MPSFKDVYNPDKKDPEEKLDAKEAEEVLDVPEKVREVASFKDIYDVQGDESSSSQGKIKKKGSQQNMSAAASILSSHATKDKRLSIRVNSRVYTMFTEINSKLGASNGSVINTFITQYVREHKDLLDD